MARLSSARVVSPRWRDQWSDADVNRAWAEEAHAENESDGFVHSIFAELDTGAEQEGGF